MSSLDNMLARLSFNGGDAEGRMRQGKLRSLQRAMLYSYQAEKIITNDNKKFRCLINPDKLKQDYDDKILSIPFVEFNLNATEEEKEKKQDMIPTNLKSGDIIHWERTNTDWMIYLVNFDEEAYLRAEIRRCKYEILAEGRRIKAYVRGPVETDIKWAQKGGVEYNRMNYSLSILVTATEENLDFFHRFARFSLKGHIWRVAAIDDFSTDGIIEVLAEEIGDNEFDDPANDLPKVVPVDDGTPFITGNNKMYAKTQETYTIINMPSSVTSGKWSVDNPKIKILEDNFDSVTIMADTYKALKFNLIFNTGTENLVSYEIEVKAF